MATYVVLIDWTQQGVAHFKDTVDRYVVAKPQIEGMGLRFRESFGRWGATTSWASSRRRTTRRWRPQC